MNAAFAFTGTYYVIFYVMFHVPVVCQVLTLYQMAMYFVEASTAVVLLV